MADMTDFSEHTITTGDDAALVLTITRSGAPLVLTGMSVSWVAADRHGGTPALGPYDAALTDPDNGVATVTVPKSDSLALSSHAYLWDAQVSDQAGNVVHVARGVLHVLASITA